MKFTGEDGSEWEAVMWDRHLKSDSENMTIKRIPLRPARPLRQEVAKLKAENEQLKTCLLQMQNAAIDLTKQLAQAERAAWDAAQDAVTLEDNFGGEAHIKYGKFEDWKKEHHEKEADKEA